LKGNSNILDLEIAGIVVERIKYFGTPDMYIQIAEYKKVYNLSEGDDYDFFYYKMPRENQTTDWDWEFFKWETKQQNKL